MKKTLKKLLSAYILCFVFCFMLFIYEPIIMYATNINDFWFDFSVFIEPVLEIFLIIFLISILGVTLVYLICFKFLKKINLYYAVLLMAFLIFFITYIQGNYLIGRLPGIDGSAIDWSIYHRENYITLGIFLILVVAGVISLKKFKLEKITQYSMYISIVIFLMLCTSLVSILTTNDRIFVKKDSLVPTFANMNVASNDKNYFIILLDAVDREIFYQEWQNDTKYKDLLNDFTFYNNALAYYPFTRDSLPLILTGKVNHNEKEFSEYSTDAYNSSPLFKELKKNNYSINLYDTDLVWNGKKNIDVANNSTSSNFKVNLFKFFKQELKYVLYKYLPYPLKRFSSIHTFDFNISFDKYKIYMGVNNNVIVENPKLNIVDKKDFKYLHLDGGHVPFDLDENLEPIEDGTYKQKVHANLKYLQNFLDRLKKNNVYDNSVIVILADHGYEHKDTTLFDRLNPILIIKGINEHHEVEYSDKAISFVELNDALVELLDDKQSKDLFENIPNERTRTVILHRFTVEYHMVEYETKGKANEIDKFKKTGRVFDR